MPYTGTGTGIQNADDIFFSNVTTQDTLIYDETTAKWNNLPVTQHAAQPDRGGMEKVSITSGSTISVDLNNGNVHQRTLTGSGSAAFSVSNVPSGVAASFTLYVVQSSTPMTASWGASVKWAGGTAPTLTATTGATDVFVFETINAGTTWFGSLVGNNYS